MALSFNGIDKSSNQWEQTIKIQYLLLGLLDCLVILCRRLFSGSIGFWQIILSRSFFWHYNNFNATFFGERPSILVSLWKKNWGKGRGRSVPASIYEILEVDCEIFVSLSLSKFISLKSNWFTFINTSLKNCQMQ